MIVPKNKNILTFLQETEAVIVAPCNGKGICGKCKVLIPSKPVPNDIESNLLSKTELDEGVRLACSRTPNKDIEIVNISNQVISNITSDYHTNYDLNPYITVESKNDKFQVYRNDKLINETLSNKAYGVAVDIGTTTVVVVMFDLIKKQPIEKKSFINPQSKYGSDVITRIQFASIKENLVLLGNLIRDKINDTIDNMITVNDISPEDVYEVVISGNTTMYHLLLHLDPTPMALAPYKTNHLDTAYLEYNKLFKSKIKACVTVFGGLDSFVGGDILSGIYSEDLHTKNQFNLLVDLGTNGEIVLVSKDKTYGASAAAGPAFEGVNITCGIGAVDGAISSYSSNDEYKTINSKQPIGICGSGLIDIVSVLLDKKIIDSTGRLLEEYNVTESIRITPSDIREIQLAKAAIRAAIEHLMNEAGVTVDNINNLLISGGFGKHINLTNLFNLGVIPEELQPKATVIGNSSLSGAVKYLFSTDHDNLNTIKNNCEIINLGTSLEFQELFVRYIHF